MKIAYNPKTAAVITTTTAVNDDIIFDLSGKKVWAKGIRMGADWSDISNAPSSLPANGGNADTVDNLHADSFVRKWYNTGTGLAQKFLSFTTTKEKGHIRIEIVEKDNSGSYFLYGVYTISWNYIGDGEAQLKLSCIYTTNPNSITALIAVRTEGNSFDLYFIFQSPGGVASYSILYNPYSVQTIDYTVTSIKDSADIPEATYTSSLVSLSLISSSCTGNAATATKLANSVSLWGNSFDGSSAVNGSITFPTIGDTATSNKISWNGSGDGADIYYQTTAAEQGNLVLNVRDDNNAYIRLALNGTFKSYFDVANSRWTGTSAQADKWTTARTFKIGNSSKTVDGSADVSWTLAEIGVQNTWRQVNVNGTSIGTATLNLSNGNYIGVSNSNGRVTFDLIGSTTVQNQAILSNGTAGQWKLQTLNIDNWNSAWNWVNSVTTADTDKVINKWNEILNFLSGIDSDNKLNTLLNSKLSITQLAAKSDISTLKNNALYWVDTKSNAAGMTNGPFTNSPFAMLSVTNYDSGTFSYRSRLAFNDLGEIKVAQCHSESAQDWTDTWYDVLTSKNSSISGSTITINGTSIDVNDTTTSDTRYVKKAGDTMTGILKFDAAYEIDNLRTINNTSYHILNLGYSSNNKVDWYEYGGQWNFYQSNSSANTLLVQLAANSTFNGTVTINNNVIGGLIINRTNAGASAVQFKGNSTNYGYLGANSANSQFLRWSADTTKYYNILDTSSTYVQNNEGYINGTKITQVTNSTNATLAEGANKLNKWFSSRVKDLNQSFGDGALRIFNATSSTTDNKCPSDASILHLAWDNSQGYDTQLALATGASEAMYFRSQNGAADKWTSWKTVLHTGNSSVSGKTITINGVSTTWIDTWRIIQINDTAIGTATLNLKNGNGISLSNTNGTVTIANNGVLVSQHNSNDTDYPLVWSNTTDANTQWGQQLYKSWKDLYYNPKNKRLTVGGSIIAGGAITAPGFVHSAVTSNANQYVLTADGGYTLLNQIANEGEYTFTQDITVTDTWTDISGFYGGNTDFLQNTGTYIVQVYFKTSTANNMYDGYFSGIMSWYIGKTNSNNADEIVLHRAGHAYANTIYLRTAESLNTDGKPYTKLQISANKTLSQNTYTFKFKRVC